MRVLETAFQVVESSHDDDEKDLDDEENWSCFRNIDRLTATPIHLRIASLSCSESIGGHQKTVGSKTDSRNKY